VTVFQSLTFPDVEDLLCTFLTGALGVPVGTRASSTSPFVRVLRTGGPPATRVSDSPQVTVEAYHAKESGAVQLLERARRAVTDLPGTELSGFRVKSVDVIGGPANLPDPSTSLFRYTFTAVVQIRGKQPI
jgi:hypothetical protein